MIKIRLEGTKEDIDNFMFCGGTIKSISKFYPNRPNGARMDLIKPEGRIYLEVEPDSMTVYES